jgi:hypothetical protein
MKSKRAITPSKMVRSKYRDNMHTMYLHMAIPVINKHARISHLKCRRCCPCKLLNEIF